MIAHPDRQPSSKEATRPRLAVVVSHPIPYYTPMYRAISDDGRVDIKAFFCSRIGVDSVLDPAGMGVEFSWETDLLSGYGHEFLPEATSIHKTTFRAVNNPSIDARLNAFQPDVILAHGYAQKTMVRAIMWGRRNHCPVMNISDRSLYGRSSPVRRAARRIALPMILNQFKAFLVIGDAVDEFYRTFGAKPEQIFRVPNVIDRGFWRARAHASDNRARMRAELGLTDEFAVLYVGKLIARKRPLDLLSALQVLRGRGSLRKPLAVRFVGDGELRGEIEAKIRAEKLPARVLGFVNIDRLPGYYCASDALAHPAENESFGMIALEAAVSGLPLVLSDRVGAIGPTSIARPGANTLVHRCGDIAGLADALERLANNPVEAMHMSRESLRLSTDHEGRLSVESTIDAINYCLA